MKPNVFLLIIDSFRSDKFYGNQKNSITPNIDSLIKNGSYFTQAISPADGTILSWSSIFTGKFPFKTGIRSAQFNKLNKDVATYFEILKKHGYHFYGYRPILSETIGLFPDFENEDSLYDFFLGISNGLGDKIIKKLQSTLKEPWFFLVHAMDLHPPITIPKEFDDEKYGTNYYEKKVSVVDTWIGKIVKNLDLNNTLLVITADHGSYIQSATIDDKILDVSANANIQIAASKLANKAPKFLHPIKDKLFFLREKINEQKKLQLTKNLDLLPHEKRALLAGRADKDHFVFDDKIRVPLLFAGNLVPKGQIVNSQVRTVDIFPTIAELINMGSENGKDGRSLKPLMEGKMLAELPAYLESNPLVLQESNDVVGIRTSKHKYFRDKDNPKKRIHLYDLKNDPFEDHNIQDTNQQKVMEMENLLQEMLKDSPVQNSTNDDESEDIARELRKLGYL